MYGSATIAGCRPKQAAAQGGRLVNLVAVKRDAFWAVRSCKAAVIALPLM